MSKKLTRRVSTKHKVKIHDNRPLPEPAESMVAPVVAHPVRHEHRETRHPFGQKVSPLSMAEMSSALPTTRSSAIYSQSSNASKMESRNTSRSTFCSGYDSADDSGTFIGLHDLGSEFGESGTSFMSWSDEVDTDTTKRLQDMYDGLERFLYDEAEFPSNASKDLLEECLIWKETFPYKRPEVADCVAPDDSSGPSRDPSGQEALKSKVKELIMEGLSSHLLSQVLETVAADVGRLRDQSVVRPVRRASRSRSVSPDRRMPALVKPRQPETASQQRHTTLDRCLGSGVGSSAFSRSLPPRSLLPPPPRVTARSAIPRCEDYPSPSMNLPPAFAGRKSPRQETILRNIQEERRRGNNNNSHNENVRVPSSHKPPWIGFANITLPPIRHDSSSSRNRRVSPSPPRAAPSPTFELHGAKKVSERRSQGGTSRKAKKYVIN